MWSVVVYEGTVLPRKTILAITSENMTYGYRLTRDDDRKWRSGAEVDGRSHLEEESGVINDRQLWRKEEERRRLQLSSPRIWCAADNINRTRLQGGLSEELATYDRQFRGKNRQHYYNLSKTLAQKQQQWNAWRTHNLTDTILQVLQFNQMLLGWHHRNNNPIRSLGQPLAAVRPVEYV